RTLQATENPPSWRLAIHLRFLPGKLNFEQKQCFLTVDYGLLWVINDANNITGTIGKEKWSTLADVATAGRCVLWEA
ncbi:hypothetical protein DPEC_G00295580, partial [Dallia pectoralis]